MPPRDDRPRRPTTTRGAAPRGAAPKRLRRSATTRVRPARDGTGVAKRTSGSRAPRPLSERKPAAARRDRAGAPAATGPMRLQRALARSGVASRRAADALVAEGRVTVNGAPAEVGQVVNPGRDTIAVDGQPIARVAAREWLVLHKPAGVLTTRSDPEGRPTVYDLVPDRPGSRTSGGSTT
jgi:23S rRNA pseudouridine2605 synthase